MCSSSTRGPSTIGHQQRSTVPALAPITNPNARLTSTTSQPVKALEDFKRDHSRTALHRSPLLAHPAQVVSPTRHCSATLCKKGTNKEKITPNALRTVVPVDIGNKITAMLAATASLKPQSLPTTPRLCLAASRASRGATGRQPLEASRSLQKTRSGKLVNNAMPELQKRSLLQAEPSMVGREQLTTIELRLNEGNNLNRRKVQKIVGGSIKRKPVHCQPEPQSVIDDYPKAQVKLDTRPSTPPGNGCIRTRDPFEDETSFEENLFDGLLSECPAGCSTPKSISKTPPELHRILQEEDYSCKPKFWSEACHTKDLDGRSSSKTKAPTIEPISGDSRVKKHPSPSKKALEDLEAAFAMYTKFKPLAGGDNTDELAKDNRGAFSVADRNRSMRKSRSKYAVPEAARQMARKGAYRIRHGLPYRYALASDQDIDDLRD